MIGINRREKGSDGKMRLGENRRGPIDPEVGVLRVDGSDGKPIALVINYKGKKSGTTFSLPTLYILPRNRMVNGERLALHLLVVQPCKDVIGYFFPVLLSDDEVSSSWKLLKVGY